MRNTPLMLENDVDCLDSTCFHATTSPTPQYASTLLMTEVKHTTLLQPLKIQFYQICLLHLWSVIVD
jgi:hypothetical protein